MARAKKCDICGKLYEPYNDEYSKYPNFIEFDCELSEDRGRKIVYRYDTCPECMERIARLIFALGHNGLFIDSCNKAFVKENFNLPLCEKEIKDEHN